MPANFDSGFSTSRMWHGLGNIVKEAPTSIDEALKLGGMDWEVIERPATYLGIDNQLHLADGLKALVRFDNNQLLSMQNTSWEVVQNRAAFSFFEPLIESGMLELQAGVSLKGGRQIALTGKIKGSVGDVVSNDPVESLLVLYNAHDGSLCLGVQFSNTRVVCSNTLAIVVGQGRGTNLRAGSNMAVSGKTVKLRHTRSIHDNLEDLQEIINLQTATFDVAMHEYKQMVKVRVDSKNVIKVFSRTFEVEEKDVMRHRNYEPIIANFESGIGSDIAGVSGTGWALYNAFTEFTTHGRSSRGETESDKVRSRFNSIYFGDSSLVNERAHKAILALAV
jgi:phage/plasmid-like protein (TIGR03299 family)